MPWRVTSPMYQRQRFVLDAEHTPAAFAELCRRYGISRKTGYKWIDRYDVGRGTGFLAYAVPTIRGEAITPALIPRKKI